MVHLRAEGGLHARVALDSPLPHAVSVRDGALVSDGYAAWHAYPGYYRSGEGQLLYDPARGIHFRTVVTVRGEGGSVRAEDGELLLDGCREATLLVVNATSFNGFDKDPVREGKPYRALAEAAAARVSALDDDALLQRHLADYQSLFSRVQLDLGRTERALRALPAARSRAPSARRTGTPLTSHSANLKPGRRVSRSSIFTLMPLTSSALASSWNFSSTAALSSSAL